VIDAALNNVQRVISKKNSGKTGHIQWLRKLNISGPFWLVLAAAGFEGWRLA
jgi:hypothetical protein